MFCGADPALRISADTILKHLMIFPDRWKTILAYFLQRTPVVLRYKFQEPGVADAAVEGYSRWFVSRLKLLEKSLEGKDFLCSNRFTLADICVSYAINLAGALDIKQALKPNIKRWSENLFSRPAFIKSKEYKYEPDQ